MENELKPELLSVAALNPFARNISSSRATMFTASHIGQTLVVEGATKRRIVTGIEREFGKYTFNKKIPVDAKIIKIIPKYRAIMGKGVLLDNPLTTIVYEEDKTKRISMVQVTDNSLTIDTKHQHYGFKYKQTDAFKNLRQNSFVEAGTVLADSPNIDEDGDYRFGVETNVAFMSVPGIIEDGIVISEDYANRIKTKGFQERTFTFGNEYFPLNLFGNENEYKPFPDIGETIGDDGLLFALRSYDDILSPVEMSKRALVEPDVIFDKLTYAVPGARIVDIKVHHNEMAKTFPTPTGMELQAKKYYEQEFTYHKTIVELYEELYKDQRENLSLSSEFHREIVYSMGYIGPENVTSIKHYPESRRRDIYGTRVDKKYRRSDINDWMVTVQFEYDVIPDKGFKLTNTAGGKGVVCAVLPTEKMPIDKDGNRADIIYDGDSIIKRMNVGVLYEHFFNAASRDISKTVRSIMVNKTPESYKAAWGLLEHYYSTVAPLMLDILKGKDYKGTIESHVDAVVEDGIYLYMPTDNPIDVIEAVRKVEQDFDMCIAPVTFGDNIVSDKPVIIGSVYMLLLEKTATDWSAVSSAKLNHFGIPAKITKSDKYSSPGRNQPVRLAGESEVRLMNATVGSDMVANLLDQSNNPTSHKLVVEAILNAEKPTGIDKVIDRSEHPLGKSRPLQFVNHVMETGGISFTRKIDDPIRAQSIEDQEESDNGNNKG